MKDAKLRILAIVAMLLVLTLTMCANHFNDYLGGIVFISYVNLLMVRGERKTFTTFPWMLCWSGVCSLCWEGIAPTILSYSTADWRDCIAYLLGMLTYWALFKKQY